MDAKLTTRDDFNPAYVLTLVRENTLSTLDAMRILEEACYVIIRQREIASQVKAWGELAPWR